MLSVKMRHASNTIGYREMMLNFLDDACSLPGMYASLLVIAKFGDDAE